MLTDQAIEDGDDAEAMALRSISDTELAFKYIEECIHTLLIWKELLKRGQDPIDLDLKDQLRKIFKMMEAAQE